jgi:sigma-B regulation protein RsbU (phosphoserine phosphatase)
MLDVCGHGVPAALIAVTVSQFLQGHRDYSSPQQERIQPHTILERLNQSFPFERFDSYFSIIYTTMKDHLSGFKPEDYISFMVVEYIG